MNLLLVGDIGGTHCRLAIARVDAGSVILEHRHIDTNAEAKPLADCLRRYLAAIPEAIRPNIASLAVAGPTDGETVRFTNLNWHLHATPLAAALGLARVHFINDFVAVGHGLHTLTEGNSIVLQAGQPSPAGARLALGAGTGLGVVQCFPHNGRTYVQPSEGGHIHFAPVDTEQIRLLRFMQAELGGRVSVERLLSGPGIEALYRFQCRKAKREPAALTAAEVSHAALANPPDPIALAALRLFSRILGQTAGDLALVSRAEGGVYLAGGIAPRIAPILQEGGLLAGFRAKGRFSDWMRTLPLHIVTDPDIGLKGAALAA